MNAPIQPIHPIQVPRDRGSRDLWYCFLILGFVALVIWSWMSRSERRLPLISVEFTGEISLGSHFNPFGRFIVRNEGSRPVRWGRAGVDIPQDPDAEGRAADSNLPWGTLEPGGYTNFPALVAHTKGFPFRVMVEYASELSVLDRIRTKLPSPLPVIDRVWPRDYVWRTYTSQWFYATADYSAEAFLRTNHSSECRESAPVPMLTPSTRHR